MTLLLLLFGGSTIASSGSSVVTSSAQFTVSGSQVWDKFPKATVVSSYAPITARTE